MLSLVINLIVIVILGVLAGMVVFGVARFRSDSQTAACKADLSTVSAAADAFDASTGAYHTDIDDLVNGKYLKAAPAAGAFSFNGTTKTVTRTPAC